MTDGQTPVNSFTDRVRDRTGTGLYKEAINLLETKIYEEFGYNVLMGAEVEFVVKCNPALPVEMRLNPFRLRGSMEAKVGNFTPSGTRDWVSQRDSLFPDSRYIAYSYRESTYDYPIYHCESVISHEANYGSMRPSEGIPLKRLCRLGDVIGGLSQTILHGTGGREWGAFRRQYVDYVSMDAYHSQHRLTNGLHLNFSLVKNGSAMDKADYYLLESYLTKANTDSLGLLIQTSDQITRYYKRGTADEAMACNVQLHGNDGDNEVMPDTPYYIEQRLPAADNDPHLSILVTLVGIYRGLKARHDGVSTHEHESLQRACVQNMGKAILHCEQRMNAKDNLIRTTLDALDEERQLGSKILEHVRAHGAGSSVKSDRDFPQNPVSPSGQAR